MFCHRFVCIWENAREQLNFNNMVNKLLKTYSQQIKLMLLITFFETRRKNWLLRLYRNFVLLFETKFDWIHHQRRKYKYFYLGTKVHEKYELFWNKINLNNIEIMKQIMLNLKYHAPTFPLKVILYMCTLMCSYACLCTFKAFLYTFNGNHRELFFLLLTVVRSVRLLQ